MQRRDNDVYNVLEQHIGYHLAQAGACSVYLLASAPAPCECCSRPIAVMVGDGHHSSSQELYHTPCLLAQADMMLTNVHPATRGRD
jgi:hypothetical protein